MEEGLARIAGLHPGRESREAAAKLHKHGFTADVVESIREVQQDAHQARMSSAERSLGQSPHIRHGHSHPAAEGQAENGQAGAPGWQGTWTPGGAHYVHRAASTVRYGYKQSAAQLAKQRFAPVRIWLPNSVCNSQGSYMYICTVALQ